MAANPILRVAPLTFPWATVDPFLFCAHHDDDYPAGNDRFGPAASLAGRDIGQDFELRDGWRMYHGDVVPGFPVHPHRGFETVTVVRSGLIDHADSLGAAARYGAGDVQWLTAGAGIQHAEMFPLVARDRRNPLEMFQIWLNLPAADKMAKPNFLMLWRDSIPCVTPAEGVRVTLAAGVLDGVRAPAPPPRSWAARPEADVAIWTIELEPGARWVLPPAKPGSNRRLYVAHGNGLMVAGGVIPGYSFVDLVADAAVDLAAGTKPLVLLLLQGRPIGEPVVQYGPFVMNTRAEVQKAFEDYRATQFGGWPWAASDPVHGGDPARFARQVDGTIERPGDA